MKKILLVAMAAVLFMACENNGGGNSGMSGKDQAALSASTSKAVSLVGKNRTTAENAIKAAGFVELKDGSGLLSLPAKAPKKAPGIKEGAIVTEVTYVYGVSDGQTEEELIQSLKDGNCVIVLEAAFSGDIFVGSGVTFITAKSETVNRRFIFTSNEMYNSLPSNPALRAWEGIIAESAEEISSEGEEYEDHSKFVAAINAMQEVAAVDAGTGFTKVDYNTGEYEGFGYYMAWINPSEEEFYESDMAYIGVPCAVGTYAVVDIEYMDDLFK